MINWIVSSSLLIVVVLLVRQAYEGRIRLRLQYALWLLVLLRLLIPGHIGSSQLSFANAAQEGQTLIEQRFVQPVIQQYAAYNEEIIINEAEVMLPDVSPVQTKAEVKITDIIEFIWIGGAFVMAMIICLSNLHFYLRLCRSRKLVGHEEKIAVYQCRWLETPCLFGLLHPAIYIAETGDETELRHVLCHEYGHYLQGDHVWSALRSLCLVLHWYNPLVWAAAIVSRRDGELACDEAVVRCLGEEERAEYGRTLLHMTIHGRGSVLNMGTTMKGSGKSIAQRIRFIANRPHMRLYTVLNLLLVAAVVAGCSFMGAEDKAIVPEPSPVPTAQTVSEEETVKLDKVPFDLSENKEAALRHQESFLNDNGDVEFFLDFEVPELAEAMPVLETEIREISVEDAKSIAHAVFGTTELYAITSHTYRDKERSLLTRDAIESDLEFARALKADEELMKAVYGGDSLHLSMGQTDVDVILEFYDNPEYLATAVSDSDREPINWEFVPDEDYPYEDRMIIEGAYEKDGVRYRLSAHNVYDTSDMHHFYQVTIAPARDSLSQMNYERAYFEHSGAEAPTEEQFIAAQTEAIRILEAMSPGRWQLSYCIGQQQYNGRYIIDIYAQPVFEGYPLIRQDVFPWVQTQEDIRFEFGVDGVLLRMEYQDPMVITRESTLGNCLDFQTAVNIARNYFRNGSIDQYDYWINETTGHRDGVSSKVYIQEVQQGWLRVPVESEEWSFTLEPVISFRGSFESFDENGEETSRSKVMKVHQNVLLNVSARDGTVLVYHTDFVGVNGLSRK